jgi:hypothetical protein
MKVVLAEKNKALAFHTPLYDFMLLSEKVQADAANVLKGYPFVFLFVFLSVFTDGNSE